MEAVVLLKAVQMVVEEPYAFAAHIVALQNGFNSTLLEQQSETRDLYSRIFK